MWLPRNRNPVPSVLEQCHRWPGIQTRTPGTLALQDEVFQFSNNLHYVTFRHYPHIIYVFLLLLVAVLGVAEVQLRGEGLLLGYGGMQGQKLVEGVRRAAVDVSPHNTTLRAEVFDTRRPI